MIPSKKNIDLVEQAIFKNDIVISEGNDLFLSCVEKHLLCIYSIKSSLEPFFSDKSPEKMNPFFKKLGNMLLSEELNDYGCFDYEFKDIHYKSSIKQKINRFFSTPINFILVDISKKTLVPLSYFSLNKGFIWNLCSNKNFRNKGHMTKLFNHFLKLVKDKQIDINLDNSIQVDNKHLELYLLKKNPSFDISKQFYFENGFKLKIELHDRIIMVYNF